MAAVCALLDKRLGIETDGAANFLATAPRQLDGTLLKTVHAKFCAHGEIEMFDLATGLNGPLTRRPTA
jgi:hypothetical protein